MKKLLLLCLVLAGCESTIWPQNYADAEKLCASNGGLQSVTTAADYYKVRCKNGAFFGAFSKKI